MARTAERVLIEPAEVARIRALVDRLDNGHRVSLLMEDGEVVRGIVSVKPSLQVFFDRTGKEGTNGVLRLEESALEVPGAAGWRDLWLDRIREVRHLQPLSAPRAMLSPPDAPASPR